jgi:hypothetical protein
VTRRPLPLGGLFMAVKECGDSRRLGRVAVVGRWNSAGSIKRCVSSLKLGADMLILLGVARCGGRCRVRC